MLSRFFISDSILISGLKMCYMFQIETQKVDFKDAAKSKVGSMDKVKHKPGGGDIKVRYSDHLDNHSYVYCFLL